MARTPGYCAVYAAFGKSTWTGIFRRKAALSLSYLADGPRFVTNHFADVYI